MNDYGRTSMYMWLESVTKNHPFQYSRAGNTRSGQVFPQSKRFNHVLDENFSNNDDIWTIFFYFVQKTTFPMSDDTDILGHFFENLVSDGCRSFGTPE